MPISVCPLVSKSYVNQDAGVLYYARNEVGDAGTPEAVQAQLIPVPTQGEFEATTGQINGRLASLEKEQSALAGKHKEILGEIRNLPQDIKTELMKEAFGEWVTELVREEVRKAMAGGG